MSKIRLATHAPIGIVTNNGWNGWPYGPATLVAGSFDGRRWESIRVFLLLGARERLCLRPSSYPGGDAPNDIDAGSFGRVAGNRGELPLETGWSTGRRVPR